MKKRPKHKKMTSAGRVSGFGLTTKVGVHFKEESKARKERRSKVEEAQRLEIADLKAQVAALPAQMEEKFEARLRQVIPPQLWEGLAAWNAAGGVGPIPVPSVSGSNSVQHVSPNVVTPPSYLLADPFAGLSPLAADNNTRPLPPPVPNTNTRSSPPPQPNTNTRPPPNTNVQPPPPPQPTQPRVSTLADLDALTKVTNRRLDFILCHLF
jgi:hypothetical protein